MDLKKKQTSKEYWANAKHVAEDVKSWPDWKRADAARLVSSSGAVAAPPRTCSSGEPDRLREVLQRESDRAARCAPLVAQERHEVAHPPHIPSEHPYAELQGRRRQAAEDRLEYAHARNHVERMLLTLWSWRDRQAMFSQVRDPAAARWTLR